MAGGCTIGLVYYFDTAQEIDRARLEAQSALWDPFTFRMLDDTGVGEGWRCLDVGAGTGSVAAWLRDRVGDAGHVVATDIETRWLEPTPMIAPLITCVVDTGRPRCEAPRIVTAALVSAANP